MCRFHLLAKFKHFLANAEKPLGNMRLLALDKLFSLFNVFLAYFLEMLHCLARILISYVLLILLGMLRRIRREPGVQLVSVLLVFLVEIYVPPHGLVHLSLLAAAGRLRRLYHDLIVVFIARAAPQLLEEGRRVEEGAASVDRGGSVGIVASRLDLTVLQEGVGVGHDYLNL